MNAVGCHTSILVLNLLLVLSAIQYVVSVHEQNSENLFPFLGYLQGFKLGQNLALELPPFVLSPIIIVPSMNRYQSFMPETSINESYETNEHTRNISYSKLSSTFADKTNIVNDDTIKESNETDFQVKEKRLAESDNTTDSLRQASGDNSSTDETTEMNEVLITTTTSEFNNSNINNRIMVDNNTKTPGSYPSALYNNEFLNNLTITSQQIEYNFTLPSTESNWQNFSMSSNISNVALSNINGTNNITEFAVFPTTQSSVITNLYPYPNAILNSLADRLSITTNPYLDEESNLPPSYDDRWQSFSSLTKLYPNSGFRPLAGLYYDGFLHKSLNKKTGFIPFDGNNNIYE